MDKAESIPSGLLSRGEQLDMSLDAFGQLTTFAGDLTSKYEMDAHLQENGYLYLPRFLDRPAVERVRLELCEQLAHKGSLDPAADVLDCVPNPQLSLGLGTEKGSANYDDVLPKCPSYRNARRFMNWFTETMSVH